MTPLLQVKDLSIQFATPAGPVHVLRDVNFEIREGEALGFVGESGSGKSVTSLAIMDLLAANAEILSGQILFRGRDLLRLSEIEKSKIRGNKISMIFQDPMTSLNPCFTVEYQIVETLQTHENLTKMQAYQRALELMKQVGIPDPEGRLKCYPHELSGGMSQRVMIAMAMACKPELLIADEPTTALDVTIQKQILDLISKLRRETKMALILVSHDLSVVAENTDNLQVMYAGEILEAGDSRSLMTAPQHPYTKGLISCLPSHQKTFDKTKRIPAIPGVVPNLRQRPLGCQFEPRCDRKKSECASQKVNLQAREGRRIRCLNPVNLSRTEG